MWHVGAPRQPLRRPKIAPAVRRSAVGQPSAGYRVETWCDARCDRGVVGGPPGPRHPSRPPAGRGAGQASRRRPLRARFSPTNGLVFAHKDVQLCRRGLGLEHVPPWAPRGATREAMKPGSERPFGIRGPGRPARSVALVRAGSLARRGGAVEVARMDVYRRGGVGSAAWPRACSVPRSCWRPRWCFGAATSTSAAAAASGRQRLPGHQGLVPPGATLVGPAPTSTALPLDVTLKPRDPAALAAEVQAVSDPGSPDYRHFLTPTQFAPAFGPTPATIAQVTAAAAARRA